MYQDFNYPIQTFHIKQLLDKNQVRNCRVSIEDQLGYFAINVSKQFAVGSQTRTYQDTKTRTTHEAFIPKTAKDWVKKLIIEFCPKLQFGWLVPQYKQITKQQKITEIATYYNLYPVPEKWDSHEYMFRWLETEPFTKSEWAAATTRVKPVKRYSGEQLANYMAEYIYDKD